MAVIRNPKVTMKPRKRSTGGEWTPLNSEPRHQRHGPDELTRHLCWTCLCMDLRRASHVLADAGAIEEAIRVIEDAAEEAAHVANELREKGYTPLTIDELAELH